MTIYKNPPGTKKPENAEDFAEVVLESLPEKKDVEECHPVASTVVVKRRRSPVCNACICILAILVLAAGVAGGFLLYKHFTHKTRFWGRCGTTFYKEQQLSSNPDTMGISQDEKPTTTENTLIKFDQDVEIDTDKQIEKIHVPMLDDFSKAQILHDFIRNITGIYDYERQICFVKPLDRNKVKQPTDLLDLLLKLQTGYYIPDSQVIQEDFTVVTPAVNDTDVFGIFVSEMCKGVPTYRLEKVEESPTPVPQNSEMNDDEDDDGHRHHEHHRPGQRGRGHHNHHDGHYPREHGRGRWGGRNKRETEPSCYGEMVPKDSSKSTVKKICVHFL